MKTLTRNIISATIVSIAALGSIPALALPADYYAPHSRLASGKWVKIKVTQNGVQRISADQLKLWGFSDPSKVKVYGFSGPSIASDRFDTSMPDDLPLQYCEFVDGNLYFYGEGDCRVISKTFDTVTSLRNYYSTYSCYFLSDAETGVDFPEAIPYTDAPYNIDTHWSIDYREPEEYNPGNGGTFYFSKPILKESPAVYEFTAPDLATQICLIFEPVARTLTRFALKPTFSSNLKAETRQYYPNISKYVSEDDHQVICCPLPGRSYQYLSHTDNNPFKFTFSNPGVANCDFVSLDYVAINYVRKNRLADHGQITMYLSSISDEENILVTDATPLTRVWNITDPLNTKPLDINYNSEKSSLRVSTGANNNYVLVAFNPAGNGFPTPEYVSTVANSDLHSHSADVDMVIITTPSLMAKAHEIADIHRIQQKLNVRVVNHLDLYNEFSSGAPSAIAYRRYLKMLNDRNPGKLQYLLLFGQGSYDNRRIFVPDKDYLMTYQCTEDRDDTQGWYTYEPRLFASDNYFGMLSDDFKPNNMPLTQVDLAVGRIPVSNTTEATDVVANIKDYFATLGTTDSYTRFLTAADSGDSNAHFEMAENGVKLAQKANPDIHITKAYHHIYKKGSASSLESLFKRMAAGNLGLFAFAGHGAADYIANPWIISRSGAQQMKFGSHPFMMLATCSALNLDRFVPSVGNTLLTATNGPVGIVSSCRTVYLSRNKVIYDNFISSYYSAQSGETIGDVWRSAFNNTMINKERSVGLNTLCYNLGGDPAIPLEVSNYKVRISSINGARPSGEEKISAYSRLHLEGYIEDPDGNPFQEYNGSGVVTILEAPKTTDLIVYDPNYDFEATTEVENDVLVSTGFTVKDGKWSADIFVPAPIINDTGTNNRMILSSHNAQGKRIALSSYNGIKVSGASSSMPDDNEGPVISALYLDSPDFIDGDPVWPNSTLYAVIAPDPSGVSVSTSNIGLTPSVTLDGGIDLNDAAGCFTPAGDGGATMTYHLSSLSAGEHSLTVNVSDNLGNRTSHTISFIVIDNKTTGTLACDDNIFNEKATLSLGVASGVKATRLIISDANGNTVATVNNPAFPYVWTPDASLKEGTYRARVLLKKENLRGVTNDVELILIRQK